MGYFLFQSLDQQFNQTFTQEYVASVKSQLLSGKLELWLKQQKILPPHHLPPRWMLAIGFSLDFEIW